MSTSAQTWAIIGGGMLGMTLAHRLAQQGKQVTLLERGSTLGGLASAWQLGGVVWDRHYHVTLLSDGQLRSLLRELDLEQDLQWVETKTGVYAEGQLYSVSNALEFLQFPPLSLVDKLRLGLTIVYASRIQNWQRLETIPVTTWLQRWSGQRTFDKFWLPLLRAKLGDNYRRASASFIWSTIARLYAARRTGLKKELFGYLPGGYARTLERFGQVLAQEGVQIHLGRGVRQVRRTATGSIQIEFDQGQGATFDQVVLTTAAPIAAQLCPQLSDDEVSRLQGIEYQGIVCASLLLKQPLSPLLRHQHYRCVGTLYGGDRNDDIGGSQQLGGYTLVYLPKYVPAQDPALTGSDQMVRDQFIPALERMYPHFHPRDIVSFQVSRVKYVLAIATLNYSQRLPRCTPLFLGFTSSTPPIFSMAPSM